MANVMEKKSDGLGIRTDFSITEEMRERAKDLAHQRSEDGNVATGDRGRDAQKQKEDSEIGCLGEIVASEAFRDTPIRVEYGDGVEYDIRLSVPGSDEWVDIEVKTRHHKPEIPNNQRDMFLRHSPDEHDVDFFMLVKVYPGQGGVYDLAELIGFCLPKEAQQNAIRRKDIEDYTSKYMVEEVAMRDNWDVLGACVQKLTS